ncbi:hypothetical protein K438DRAFT_1976719 [Mycena galopus ATCC 62051]|nr:hypothetical protein K438DRAFT_1976719 [Mycena galopus ATCC 62051]
MYPYQPPPAYHAPYPNHFAAPTPAYQAPRSPPVHQNSNVGRRGGITIHVCHNSHQNCVKCKKSQEDRGMLDIDPHGRRQPHRQINVCTMETPRSRSGRVPQELQGLLHNFDFTVQLPAAGNDPNTWLFNDGQLMAVIGPIVNGISVIQKAFPEPGINQTLKFSRVNLPGPSYTVEYMLQSNDPYDIGAWAWYRYANGSVRVWHWDPYDPTLEPCLVAWKNRNNWHWYFDPVISQMLKSECEAAAIIVICGMVLFNGEGRTLTMT